VLAGAGAENAGVRSDQHLALIGSRNWEPDSAREAENQYNLGVGEATLWLTDPAILRTASAGDPLDVRARVGAGHLILVLPDGVSTRVDLAVAAGEVTYPDGTTAQFDGQNGSRQQRVNVGPAGPPRMIVDVQVGAGQLELQTATGNAVTTTPSPSAVKPAPTATASPRSAVTASPTASN
jgi:hypothetical protein